MDDEIIGVAERLASEFHIALTTIVRVVTDAVEDLPGADPLLIEHAARARLERDRPPRSSR